MSDDLDISHAARNFREFDESIAEMRRVAQHGYDQRGFVFLAMHPDYVVDTLGRVHIPNEHRTYANDAAELASWARYVEEDGWTAEDMRDSTRAFADEAGVEALAWGVFRARRLDERDPETTNDAIEAARARIRKLDAATSDSPDGEALDAIRRPIEDAIRAGLARVAAERAERARPTIEALRWEVERLARSPDGWRDLGEMADAMPAAFPAGFADRWLDVATGAMLEAGPEGWSS